MPVNRKYLFGCMALALMLCAAQILGNTMLILACLVLFLLLLGWSCTQAFTLPILLFFLPWSPLLRTSPDEFSFFTFGLVLISLISVVKHWHRFKRYHIVLGLLLLIVSLVSKLWDGNGLSFDYIAFIMLIVMLPVVKDEWKFYQYDFYQLTIYFSIGVAMAALCARWFSGYSNIARYINVHSYLTITRMSGFYGDPNYYTAQITAALGAGCLAILREKTKGRLALLGILLVLLLYCGFMSGSKSFALVAICVVFLWVIELMRMRGRIGRKITFLLCGVVIAFYMFTSTLFGDWINVLMTRLSFVHDLSDLTTGRTELWQNYLDVFLSDGKVLLLGKGFTDVKVNDRASHNTIIQMVFQFGLIGTPLLVAWSIYFLRDGVKQTGVHGDHWISALILMAGVFVPWLALDMLYFDDYFLLQWLVFAGLQYIHSEESVPQLYQENSVNRKRIKRGVRVVWRR